MTRVRSLAAVLTAWMSALLLLSGCAGDERLQTSDAGKTTAFLPGTPNFDFEAVETVRGDTSGADLTFRIPWESLVFERDSAGYRAKYELRAKFTPEIDSIGVRERSWDGTFRSSVPVGNRSTQEQLVTRWVSLPQGKYVAEILMEDLLTGSTAVRRQGVTIFSAGDSCARILRITLEHRGRDSLEPFLPLHIPEATDSLQAVVTLRNPSHAAGNGLRLLVLRYPTDSLPSSLPYYLQPNQGSIRRTAVDFRKADTVVDRAVPFLASREQREIIPLGGLRPGYHEVVAQCLAAACGGTGQEQLIQRSRGLAIVDRTFPRMTMLNEMLGPLVYLATEKEYREITAAKTEEEKRKEFEKFWLHLGQTAERAANLIKQYYTRIEEANLFYSAYKEGWKTDRGMVYVIFGPPGQIGWGNRQEVWSYSSGYTFLFELVYPTRTDEPFENWMLSRDASYEGAWDREVDRWRRGQQF